MDDNKNLENKPSCPSTSKEEDNASCPIVSGGDVCDLHTTSFKKIVDKYAFVDKSLLIEELMTSRSNVGWATAPRLFGKSTNLDMFKTFLSLQVNSEGVPISNIEDGENYKLFQKHSLKIYTQTRELFDKYCGQFPVVYVDFGKVEGGCNAEIVNAWINVWCESFKEHSYLLKQCKGKWIWSSKELCDSSFKVDRFVRYMEHKNVENPNSKDVIKRLWFLCNVLFKHFNRKIIILVDNYDNPFMNAIINHLESDECMETIKQVSGQLLSFFYEKSYVAKALLNAFYPYLEVGLCKGYGFTGQEVRDLLKKPCFQMVKQQDLAQWYGGYKVHWDKEVEIYNPWSVLNCLRSSVSGGEACFQVHTPVSEGIIDIYEVVTTPEVQGMIKELLNNVVLSTSACCVNCFEDCTEDHSHNTDSPIPRIEDNEKYMSLNFLSYYGYLNKKQMDGENNTYLFNIPNIEMKKTLSNLILQETSVEENKSKRTQQDLS